MIAQDGGLNKCGFEETADEAVKQGRDRLWLLG
jgi:hypothetical protein